MKLVDVHVLHTFPASNLNRDDTGNPKTTNIGGVVRGMVSSQSQKYWLRDKAHDLGLIGPMHADVRTRNMHKPLVERLTHAGKPSPVADLVARACMRLLDEKYDERAKVVLNLGHAELDHLADTLLEGWDGSWEDAAHAKKPERKTVDVKPLAKLLLAGLDGGKAIRMAAFGRMIAEAPTTRRDAAMCVSHAFTTHEAAPQADYYTAADDLASHGEAGRVASQMYNQGCFYRYATINLDLLLSNLKDDRNLSVRAAQGLTEAFVRAIPLAKQGAYAPFTAADMVAVRVSDKGAPLNAMTAFSKPIQVTPEVETAQQSVTKFADRWAKLRNADPVPGARDRVLVHSATCDVPHFETLDRLPDLFSSVGEMIEEVLF